MCCTSSPDKTWGHAIPISPGGSGADWRTTKSPHSQDLRSADNSMEWDSACIAKEHTPLLLQNITFAHLQAAAEQIRIQEHCGVSPFAHRSLNTTQRYVHTLVDANKFIQKISLKGGLNSLKISIYLSIWFFKEIIRGFFILFERLSATYCINDYIQF